jgi:hypothetical protein
MKLNVNGRLVNVRELTVGEVREYIRQEEAGWVSESLDRVTDMILEDVSLRDIVAMTDLTLDEIDGMTTRQLQDVVAACREMNPGFFLMAARAKALLERVASQISTSASLA